MRKGILTLCACAFIGTLVGCASDSPPSWVRWEDASWYADFGENGTREQVVLSSRSVSVIDQSGTTLCTTPQGWQVMDAELLENSEELSAMDLHEPQELVLLAWRKENFGSSKPFWHDEANEPAWTQHLFVLDVQNDGLKELWMSSNLGAEISEMNVEGVGRIALTERDGTVTHWQRCSWGFELA